MFKKLKNLIFYLNTKDSDKHSWGENSFTKMKRSKKRLTQKEKSRLLMIRKMLLKYTI